MKELKRKLVKVKKIRFIRNIIITVVALMIVALIINIAPGYKRDKYKDVVNLIINEENKTEELKHDIYINENKTVYISEEDIKILFDATIYYDNENNQIITTSDTKVANIVIDEKKMVVNNSNVGMIDSIIRIDNNIYLPISDMTMVYNIDVKYVESTNRVVIDDLSKGMIRAIVSEDTDIKFRPRRLSKDIGTLKEGEVVYCFYTTSKGWRQIRTEEGILGYIKANKLTSEYILRQDMMERGEAKTISRDNYENKQFDIIGENETQKINIKNIFNIKEDNIEIDENFEYGADSYRTWASISNNLVEKQTNIILKEYESRTNIINMIVKKITENDINGVVIDFNGIEDKETMLRFMIELTPKLRESGIETSIVLNENIEKNDYIHIVDYTIE